MTAPPKANQPAKRKNVGRISARDVHPVSIGRLSSTAHSDIEAS